MHIHTTVYSKCSHMAPEVMAQRAREVGLDGVVITEHNAIWSEDEISVLRRKFPELTILRGVEVSAASNHILVYGVTDFEGFRTGMPVPEVVERAHERGGVAVWAHPLRHRVTPDPAAIDAPFDACEVHSINIDPLDHEAYLALAKRLGVPPMSNSDAHHEPMVGCYATQFDAPVANEHELAEAIRAGAFATKYQSHVGENAWRIMEAHLDEKVQRAIASGMTDLTELKRKSSASLKRIERHLKAASA